MSAETVRRWVHEVGWVWTRAERVAKDHDPHRVDRLARLPRVDERWQVWDALVLADARDIHLRPKVGDAWRPKGTHGAVMTLGTHAKHSLAGALEVATGTGPRGIGPRKRYALFRPRLQVLDAADPAAQYRRISIVVDDDRIHQANAVAQW